MQIYWKYQHRLAPYLFVAPFLILFLLFVLIPFLFSLGMSFTNWQGSDEWQFIGADNYARLIVSGEFLNSLLSSAIIFFLYVPAMLLIGLLLAVALNQPWLKFKGFFRTAFFIPNITSVVAVSFVFLLLFNTKDGMINHMLMSLHMIDKPLPFLDHPYWARITVAAIVMFRWTGYNMLLLLSGLQNIPQEIYEAAKMDGAGAMTTFFRIIIPMMRRILLFCTVLSTIGSFSLFVEPYIVTKGGPLQATTTPILLLFRESFEYFNFGYASAISILFFIIMITLTALQLRLFSDRHE